VKFIESFEIEEKDKLYIVLEYVGGGTLQDLLSRVPDGRLCFRQAQSFFRDLMHGLEYIHSKGIVHRDIKPGNLMITVDGTLKILDFGVAELLRSFEDSSYSSKTQGTPAFQPPEIASGAERFSGVGGDVWAAGVSLFYIITGKYPFEGSTAYTLFENIAQAKYTIPSWVEKQCSALADLLRGLLEPDKNKRLTVEDILKHQWVQEDEDNKTFAEIIPTPTMFTRDFIQDIVKMKKESSDSSPKKRGWNNCICVLF